MLPATLALVVVVQGVVAQCGQEGQVPAPCLPRLTSLALDPASWPGHRLLAPRQLEVARCAGSCPHPQHSCRPAQLRRLQLRALLARVAVNHTGVADTDWRWRSTPRVSAAAPCLLTPAPWSRSAYPLSAGARVPTTVRGTPVWRYIV